MQKWEYTTLHKPRRSDEVFERHLADLGSKGWELCGSLEGDLIFKRPKEFDWGDYPGGLSARSIPVGDITDKIEFGVETE